MVIVRDFYVIRRLSYPTTYYIKERAKEKK